MARSLSGRRSLRTHRADEAAFERVLDYLFSIDEQRWTKEMSDFGFRDMLEFDAGNEILRTAIKGALAGTDASTSSH